MQKNSHLLQKHSLVSVCIVFLITWINLEADLFVLVSPIRENKSSFKGTT